MVHPVSLPQAAPGPGCRIVPADPTQVSPGSGPRTSWISDSCRGPRMCLFLLWLWLSLSLVYSSSYHHHPPLIRTSTLIRTSRTGYRFFFVPRAASNSSRVCGSTTTVLLVVSCCVFFSVPVPCDLLHIISLRLTTPPASCRTAQQFSSSSVLLSPVPPFCSSSSTTTCHLPLPRPRPCLLPLHVCLRLVRHVFFSDPSLSFCSGY